MFLFLFDGLTREKEPKYGNDLGREKRWFVERRARSGAKGEGVAGEVGIDREIDIVAVVAGTRSQH